MTDAAAAALLAARNWLVNENPSWDPQQYSVVLSQALACGEGLIAVDVVCGAPERAMRLSRSRTLEIDARTGRIDAVLAYVDPAEHAAHSAYAQAKERGDALHRRAEALRSQTRSSLLGSDDDDDDDDEAIVAAARAAMQPADVGGLAGVVDADSVRVHSIEYFLQRARDVLAEDDADARAGSAGESNTGAARASASASASAIAPGAAGTTAARDDKDDDDDDYVPQRDDRTAGGPMDEDSLNE